jgi:hypothetical protein
VQRVQNKTLHVTNIKKYRGKRILMWTKKLIQWIPNCKLEGRVGGGETKTKTHYPQSRIWKNAIGAVSGNGEGEQQSPGEGQNTKGPPRKQRKVWNKCVSYFPLQF